MGDDAVETVIRGFEDLERRVNALELWQNGPAGPERDAPKAAPPKRALRPSEPTIAEWSRAALEAGKLAGRWTGQAPDVAALVTSMISVPALALVQLSERESDPSKITLRGVQGAQPRPHGAPIFLARIMLSVAELAAAWGVDLDAAMSVAHEDTLGNMPGATA